jgi:hypothetical protein
MKRWTNTLAWVMASNGEPLESTASSRSLASEWNMDGRLTGSTSGDGVHGGGTGARSSGTLCDGREEAGAESGWDFSGTSCGGSDSRAFEAGSEDGIMTGLTGGRAEGGGTPKQRAGAVGMKESKSSGSF